MTDVDKLMKRCQIGVGGRDALNNAHSIMADCYGTLGKLQADNLALRRVVDAAREYLATGRCMCSGNRTLPRKGHDESCPYCWRLVAALAALDEMEEK